MIHGRAEDDRVGLAELPRQFWRVSGRILVGIVQREVVLPEIDKFGGRAASFGCVEGVPEGDSSLAFLSEAATDSDDVYVWHVYSEVRWGEKWFDGDERAVEDAGATLTVGR